MGNMIHSTEQLKKLLVDLIHLDFDSIHAYDAAIERAEAKALRQGLLGIREDHQRHTRDLSSALRELGEDNPPSGPDLKVVLTEGKVVAAGLGSDHTLLLALRSNEEQTNSEYEQACKNAFIPEAIKQILRQNWADERRHMAYIEEQMRAFDQEPAYPSPAGPSI